MSYRRAGGLRLARPSSFGGGVVDSWRLVPLDVALNHTQLFLTRVLPQRGRILEVGCGAGQLAWRLAHLGHEVHALDRVAPSLPAHPRLRFLKGEVETATVPTPFDAIVMVDTLRGLSDVESVVHRLASWLTPGGLLVVDELDVGHEDSDVARWFAEHAGTCLLSGASDVDALGGELSALPRERWQARFKGQHRATVMLEALRQVGLMRESERGPALFRELAATLVPTPRGVRLAEFLLQAEEQRIAEGSLRPVGVRAVVQVGSAPE